MGRMKLFTKEQEAQLLKHGADTSEDKDYPPVVKLFTPDAGATWLISEIDPRNPDIAFGLCDLGVGFAEMGCVSISELESVRGAIGLPVERDKGFEGKYPLSVYAEAASVHGRITTSGRALENAASKRGQAVGAEIERDDDIGR
jgi:Protein of unknown function (DUF2958)